MDSIKDLISAFDDDNDISAPYEEWKSYFDAKELREINRNRSHGVDSWCIIEPKYIKEGAKLFIYNIQQGMEPEIEYVYATFLGIKNSIVIIKINGENTSFIYPDKAKGHNYYIPEHQGKNFLEWCRKS